MTRPTYLFIASSIVRAFREVNLVPLGGQALQWLSVYEVLNVSKKKLTYYISLTQRRLAP